MILRVEIRPIGLNCEGRKLVSTGKMARYIQSARTMHFPPNKTGHWSACTGVVLMTFAGYDAVRGVKAAMAWTANLQRPTNQRSQNSNYGYDSRNHRNCKKT